MVKKFIISLGLSILLLCSAIFANVKVKVIQTRAIIGTAGMCAQEHENEVNDFIKDKKVLQIGLSSTEQSGSFIITTEILYEE